MRKQPALTAKLNEIAMENQAHTERFWQQADPGILRAKTQLEASKSQIQERFWPTTRPSRRTISVLGRRRDAPLSLGSPGRRARRRESRRPWPHRAGQRREMDVAMQTAGTTRVQLGRDRPQAQVPLGVTGREGRQRPLHPVLWQRRYRPPARLRRDGQKPTRCEARGEGWSGVVWNVAELTPHGLDKQALIALPRGGRGGRPVDVVNVGSSRPLASCRSQFLGSALGGSALEEAGGRKRAGGRADGWAQAGGEQRLWRPRSSRRALCLVAIARVALGSQAQVRPRVLMGPRVAPQVLAETCLPACALTRAQGRRGAAAEAVVGVPLLGPWRRVARCPLRASRSA